MYLTFLASLSKQDHAGYFFFPFCVLLPQAGRWGKQRWYQGTEVKLHRMNKSTDLIHSVRTIVNNTVWNAGNLLNFLQIAGAPTKKKKI